MSASLMCAAFASLGLAEVLVEGLAGLGFAEMTAVQEQALPGILAGEDLVVEAEPGSGKTVAFGLGALRSVLPHLPPAPARVRALLVCPARELAEQVAGEVRKLARRTPNVKVLTLCGGVPFAPQRGSLKQGAHVVVGTPGRLEEHLRKGSLSLDALELLVLDEADRMLSMGFFPQIEAVIRHAPAQRQTLLFSATIPDAIAELSLAHQRDPRRIHVPAAARRPALEPVSASAACAGVDAISADAVDATAAAAAPAGSVVQRFHRVPAEQRLDALARWLLLEQPRSVLVFCNTRLECAAVARELARKGWVAAAIHGEMPQRERAHVMRLFAGGSCTVLAATDVAARGWDIEGLEAVVNLGLSPDPSVHLHRVGRTGRAGQAGVAVSYVSDEDLPQLAAIERAHGITAVLEPLPPASTGAAASRTAPPSPPMVTLLLSAGKNKKLRPGDILGALTAAGDVRGEDVGAIHVDENAAYVAVRAEVADTALARLCSGTIKGRSVKARRAGSSLRDAP